MFTFTLLENNILNGILNVWHELILILALFLVERNLFAAGFTSVFL